MPRELHRDYVRRMVEQENAQLVEVLPSREYRAEHIAKAINIPLAKLASKIKQLDRDRPVITYCADYQWDLSARAAWRLESLGFNQVFRYTAGKADWSAFGLPMEGKQTIVPRVGGSADRDVPTCRLDEKIGEIKSRLGDASICVVVNEKQIVLGLLTPESLSEDPDQTAEAAMESSPQTFRPNVPIKQAAKQMTRFKLDHALVTTSDGELIGALYRERFEEREQPREAVEALAAGGL